MNHVKVGILGLGTVGLAVAENVCRNAQIIKRKTGLTVEIVKGADIRKVKPPCPVTRNPQEIIDDPSISIVVETIGGVEAAKTLVLAALRAGKHVVTSNKELVATHMDELYRVAAANGVFLLFEAAVGGGIPIINTLRDNLSSNKISEIYGIVNGTTNYILSKMTSEGRDFADVLEDAKRLGYAEANPKNDIEGYDASYKAAILASAAYGAKIKMENVCREGIENITVEDIVYASEAGYAIKLLAAARLVRGGLEVGVGPVLVAKSHPLASVGENNNAIYIKGDPIGEIMLYGPGAGGSPTSAAVISDIINIAVNGAPRFYPQLANVPFCSPDEIESRFYLRLQTADRHGVLAGIAQVFSDKQVSIAAVTQKETVGNTATIVILLHKVAEKNLRAAVDNIKKLSLVKKVCSVIRVGI